MLPVQVLTFSRAGVLALAVSLGLTAVGWLLLSRRQRFSLYPLWRQLTLSQRLVGLTAGLLLLGLGLFWLQSSFAGRGSSTQFRFVLWDVALTVFQQQPLTGAGPGNFGRALLRLNQADLPRFQIASAHNIYLNTAAELGLAGLLAGGYLLFRLGQTGWQHWRRLTTTPERLRLLVCGAAVVGLLAQTLVDAYSSTPIMLLVAALAAAMVAPLDLPPAPARQRGAAALAALLLAVYAAAFVRLAQSDLAYQRSFSRESAGNLAEAVAQARQSYELDPWLVGRLFRLALLEARLAGQNDDPALAQAAIDHYRAGLAQEPIWGLNSANLAGLLWQQGQRTEAIATMQRTLAAEKVPLYWVNLGYFYEQEGQWAEARAAYVQALALDPQLAGSDFWGTDPARAEAWPLITGEAARQKVADQDLLPVKLALAREEFDTVEALLGPQPDLTRETVRHALVEVYLSRGQSDRAAALLASVGLVGADDYLLAGRAKLAEDAAAAETLLRTAAFLGSHRAYYYLGQLHEGWGDLPAAEAAYRRGFLPHFTAENIEITIYGRAAANDLAPQLLRIGVSPAAAAPWLQLARLYEAQQRF
ncbi:MAG: tetratricopeptide repeat protein [Anaerolineales bacterium]|nr:tetratricopeptide repeat protein [Anaerolineales bacterium]